MNEYHGILGSNEDHLPLDRWCRVKLADANVIVSIWPFQSIVFFPTVKIRTPKRQRKDSVTDKEPEKKMKVEDFEPTKLMHIDETAIDGIELMAHYKNNQEDEEKPSTEDEKEIKSEETAEEETDRDVPERDKDIQDKYMSEKEKDSFSEMEDDEKFNKSDTDNESDGKGDKSQKERKFKNLKVCFYIFLLSL